eukprot:CAMPEP_0185781340 /NCGR_PEP_ID=MMETSP1174-20130828/102017_1 /TAXON_ID=35687 /ORGANISM="Dictyocha speculum, Strain CCMP1381" /LENGTH=174 /DNA_ID=CAMNT_0028471271 /DNA_START=18 /DNA_END=542 /DNA_ORIENTATION=+
MPSEGGTIRELPPAAYDRHLAESVVEASMLEGGFAVWREGTRPSNSRPPPGLAVRVPHHGLASQLDTIDAQSKILWGSGRGVHCTAPPSLRYGVWVEATDRYARDEKAHDVGGTPVGCNPSAKSTDLPDFTCVSAKDIESLNRLAETWQTSDGNDRDDAFSRSSSEEEGLGYDR